MGELPFGAACIVKLTMDIQLHEKLERILQAVDAGQRFDFRIVGMPISDYLMCEFLSLAEDDRSETGFRAGLRVNWYEDYVPLVTGAAATVCLASRTLGRGVLVDVQR